MNLYRSKGRHWTGTQADARIANDGDKDFEHIEVPTDKPGLIAFLNKMEERTGKGMATSEPATDMALAEPYETFHRDLVATEAHYETQVSIAPTNPADCPACNRSKAVAKRSVNSQAAINIKADLEDVTDKASLMQIVELAQLRLSDVIAKSVSAN